MNFNISGGAEQGYPMAKEANAIGQYKQRTLKALNALQKL